MDLLKNLALLIQKSIREILSINLSPLPFTLSIALPSPIALVNIKMLNKIKFFLLN